MLKNRSKSNRRNTSHITCPKNLMYKTFLKVKLQYTRANSNHRTYQHYPGRQYVNLDIHTLTTLPSSIQWMRLASESSDRHSRLNSSHDLVHSFENVFRHSRLQVELSALEQQCNLAESIPMRSIRDTSIVVGPEADSEPWRKHCHSLSCKLQ